MTLRTSVRIALVLTVIALGLTSCSRNKPTQPWPANTDAVVFGEISDFGAHQIGFQAFGGSKYDALSIDSTQSNSGKVSLKFTVPDVGDPSGSYAGGAFVANYPRNLSQYNAVSFWVKASRAVNLAEAGLGNDNTGTSLYTAERTAIPMKTWWTRVLLPIPLPSKLSAERGLFFVSVGPTTTGPQAGTGFTFWVDDVQFVNDPTVTDPRPSLSSQSITTVVGAAVNLGGATRTSFTVDGAPVTVAHMPGYFTFAATNPEVATAPRGVVTITGAGLDTLTAKLGSIDAIGRVTLSVSASPTTPAPTPIAPSSGVISLFSDRYPNYPIENWRAFGSQAVGYQELPIAGNNTKLYTGLANGFVGISFSRPPVDASAMTYFHLDVWLVSGTAFKVKLVDFGPDGVSNFPSAGDDTQSELTFSDVSTPPIATGSWLSLDIPLTNFTALANPARHVAQLVLSGDTPIVFVDNIYFHSSSE